MTDEDLGSHGSRLRVAIARRQRLPRRVSEIPPLLSLLALQQC